MSAALAGFAGEDRQSVSAQLKPLLESIEAICKEFSIAADSGVALDSRKVDNGQAEGDRQVAAMEQLVAPNIMVTKATGSVSPLPRHDSEGRGPLPAPGTGNLRPFLASISTSSPLSKGEAVVMMSPGAVDMNEEEEAWSAVSRTVKPIADVLRTDRLRSSLGESSLPEASIQILRKSAVHRSTKYLESLQEAQVELMRVIANLCIDADDNRTRLLQLQAVPAILAVVDDLLDDPVPEIAALSHFDTQTLSLLRAATGAVLNLQLDHPATRRAIGTNSLAMRTIYRLASSGRIYTPNEWAEGNHGFARAARGSQKEAENMDRVRVGGTISTWAWRILQDVNASGGEGGEDDTPGAGLPGAAEASRAMLASASINATAVALRALLAASAPDREQADDVLPWTSEDVTSLIQSDSEILSASAELIEATSLDYASFRLQALAPDTWADPVRFPGALEEDTPLKLYVRFFERAHLPASWTGGAPRTQAPDDEKLVADAAKQYAQCKAAVARSIVAIASEDQIMDVLFGASSTVGAQSEKADGTWFIDTLKSWIQARHENREDLVSIALLTLGNLARKDSHCIALIEEHHIGDLLAPVLADESIDIKVAHGMVGLLKNLAIPKENKDRIGALGVIKVCARFLDRSKDMVQPLQFGTVGLLKHLCSGSVSNSVELCDDAVLDALLDLNRRTEDVPTKMESTRVLVNVIKTLWGAKGDVVEAARSRISQQATASALAEMMQGGSKYPILINESIIALTLLATGSSGSPLVAGALLSTATIQAQAEQAEEPGKRPPRRQGTMDSVGSNASQHMPTPSNALEMLQNVIARRDARMPPQYASNACSLVIAILEASKGAADQDRMDTSIDQVPSGGDAIKTLAARVIEPLEWLVKEGTPEVAALAKQALEPARQHA